MFVDDVYQADGHCEHLEEGYHDHYDVFWRRFVYHFAYVWQMSHQRPEKWKVVIKT